MKKVINITLGGVVFAIEEDAFTALSSYIEAIKKSLSGNADRNEVVIDVEIAIAEKLVARKCNEKKAVTVSDVEAVTLEMGNPSDFKDENENNKKQTEEIHSDSGTKKRLYRDGENTVLAGVASGIAQYFDIDPVIVRLVFVFATLINGFGILAYIILWLVVPEAKTTQQKFEMRGEQLTLKEIKEQVKKNLENIQNTNYEPVKGLWAKIRKVLITIFDIVGRLLRGIFGFFRYFFGLGLILLGALGLAGTVSVFSVALLSGTIIHQGEVQATLEIIRSSTLGVITLLSAFFVTVIPLFVCILAGLSMLAKRNHFTIAKSVSLGVIWFSALTFFATLLIIQAEQIVLELEAQGYDHGGHSIHVHSDPFRITVSEAPADESGLFPSDITESQFGNQYLESSLSEYFLRQSEFSWQTSDTGYRFCTLENLDTNETLFPLSVWVFCSEYDMDNGVLKALSGSSGPVKVFYPNENSFYDVRNFSHVHPRDGSLYSKDIQRIFSPEVQERIRIFDVTELQKKNEIFARDNIARWLKIKDAVLRVRLKVFSKHIAEILLYN